jgi:hypothetical protein
MKDITDAAVRMLSKDVICSQNAETVIRELEWLTIILEARHQINLGKLTLKGDILYLYPAPDASEESGYAKMIKKYRFNLLERLTLALAFVPHIDPKLLDLFKRPEPLTEFGGISGKNHRGFIPTGETLMFIIAGSDITKRFEILRLFEKDHVFQKENILSLEPPPPGEPALSGVLTVSEDFLDLIIKGTIRKPDLRPDFPAKLLQTEMIWEDIVLPSNTFSQLQEIELWIEHHQVLASDPVIGKKLKPGFRALFYGPPGTGKTLSACLIGKKTGRDVYRVDLSTIVSKYIGETEKNLARLFDRAARKDWILFFDEADALFGKRTNVNDSHDRYANQEVSYLLQRIEYHEGLVILATNLKSNIDNAFLRRFQSVVYFPMPKAEERLQLWKKAFSENIPADPSIPLSDIARKYEISGSLILNIASHCTLRALSQGSKLITMNILMDGIVRELSKEGKTI